MTMTKKSFEALAHALRICREAITSDYGTPQNNAVYTAEAAAMRMWRRKVIETANVCAGSNGLFDRGRFYSAAGFE